jgi:SAM-dependent methyltransferase
MVNARDEAGTWHFGLIARWWAEFNEPEPQEVAYLDAAIRRHGEPALDLGCGTGRILLPLLEAGLDVDGADVSEDMIALARGAADRGGLHPMLRAQAMHALDVERRYRTIFMVGVFGIGGNRARDREALRRAFDHLEPGGTLLINHELPYARIDAARWATWLPDRTVTFPRPWRDTGERRALPDGDELELISRGYAFDALAQRQTLEMRARLWRDGRIVQEETRRLQESLYFAQEVVQLLTATGFEAVTIESGYSGRPADSADAIVMFVARKPA